VLASEAEARHRRLGPKQLDVIQIMGIVAMQDLELEQLDVKIVFL
jgi:hypothetical protein